MHLSLGSTWLCTFKSQKFLSAFPQYPPSKNMETFFSHQFRILHVAKRKKAFEVDDATSSLLGAYFPRIFFMNVVSAYRYVLLRIDMSYLQKLVCCIKLIYSLPCLTPKYFQKNSSTSVSLIQIRRISALKTFPFFKKKVFENCLSYFILP